MPYSRYGSLCIKCKGYKRLCGLEVCPILERFRSHFNIVKDIKDKFDGSTPPSLLVGEYGYPRVRVMLNIPPMKYGLEARIYDDPLRWWGRYSLEDIIGFRSGLLASTIRLRVNDVWKLYEKEISLSAASVKPVDSEVTLDEKPMPVMRFNGITKPVALSAYAKDIRITSTPYIGSLLEKRIHDDVKASNAVVELYLRGYNNYTLINALSGGLLGTLRNRRIVPTRWAITAVDSILGDFFRRRVIHNPYINYVYAFREEYLGNKFLVILAPGPLEIEWIEAWHPRSLWIAKSDRVSAYRVNEDIWGRQTDMDGGYIAARLPVLEYLYKIGKQATGFIYREILPSYYAPVGNWHIRETVRNSLRNEPRKYNTLEEALENELLFFKAESDIWIKNSRLIKNYNKQKRLTEYIKRELERS